MCESLHSASYSSICNVLRQWNISLIPTYRVYRLYNNVAVILRKIEYVCFLHSMLEVKVLFEQLLFLQVSGGAGFVGSHLVDRLMMDGHEVHYVHTFIYLTRVIVCSFYWIVFTDCITFLLVMLCLFGFCKW